MELIFAKGTLMQSLFLNLFRKVNFNTTTKIAKVH